MATITAREKKFDLMTKSSVERLVCRMAIPTISIMMISALYNMADTYFVSYLGTSATAGVGIAFSLMSIIQAIGFFFGHGSGTYLSRKLGEKNEDEAAIMAATGLFASFGCGILFALFGLYYLESLSTFLGATNSILPFACSYMKYILLAMPFMTGSLTLNNQLRLQGSATYAMYGMIAGAVLNIFLDPLLIFGLKLGVAGAGMATFISQMFSFSLLFIATAQEGNVRIHFDNISIKPIYYREIFKGGFPSLCRQGLNSIAIMSLNKIAASYGDVAIAAMTISGRIAHVTYATLIGLGQGFQPVCGFNYGAKLYSRVKRAFWFLVKSSTVFLTLFATIEFIFAREIIALFSNDAEVLRIGAEALRFQCLTFPLMGWHTACSMMMQTIGETARASILAVARQGLYFIPLLFFLTSYYGLKGLEATQPIADIFSFLTALPFGYVVLKKMPKNDG